MLFLAAAKSASTIAVDPLWLTLLPLIGVVIGGLVAGIFQVSVTRWKADRGHNEWITDQRRIAYSAYLEAVYRLARCYEISGARHVGDAEGFTHDQLWATALLDQSTAGATVALVGPKSADAVAQEVDTLTSAFITNGASKESLRALNDKIHEFRAEAARILKID